jgi:hypothetical protein
MTDDPKPSASPLDIPPDPPIPPLPNPSGRRGPLDDPGGVNFRIEPTPDPADPPPLKPGDLGPDGNSLG